MTGPCSEYKYYMYLSALLPFLTEFQWQETFVSKSCRLLGKEWTHAPSPLILLCSVLMFLDTKN